MTAWPVLLDALEEQALRLAEALRRGERDVVLPDLELDADGPLPAELHLRAQVVLQRLRETEAQVGRLSGDTARAAATYASH